MSRIESAQAPRSNPIEEAPARGARDLPYRIVAKLQQTDEAAIVEIGERQMDLNVKRSRGAPRWQANHTA